MKNAISNVSRKDALLLRVGYPVAVVQYLIGLSRKRTIPIIRTTSNWWVVPFVHLGIRKSATACFRNGKSVEITKESLGRFTNLVEYYSLPKKLITKYKVAEKDGIVHATVEGRHMRLDIAAAQAILSEFFYDRHSDLNVKGRQVVDIGAYIGDTPVAYVVKGRAKVVYGFEPYPFIYQQAVEIVKGLGLEGRVMMLNEAVGAKSGFAYLDSMETSFGKVGSETKVRKRSTRVPIVTLRSVINKFKIRNGALKIDCEGGEYGIMSTASSADLASFDSIHIEYHYGYLDLVKRLESEGFIVRCTSPWYNFIGFGKQPMLMGELFADRRKEA